MNRGREVLLVPGFGNSGPGHWQTLWEGSVAGARRVDLGRWDDPSRAVWTARIDAAVRACGRPPVIVAHSLGAVAVACWASALGGGAHAALLVAPPDMSHPHLPVPVRRFGAAPPTALGFPTILAASSSDPYCDPRYARALARVWGAEFVDLGDAGHVNAASGNGPWPEGVRLLQTLLKD